MAFIGLGKINKNGIPLIIASVFCFLNRLINKIKEAELFKNVILTNIFISGADILIIIPYLIYKFRAKKIKHVNENENQNSNLTRMESLKIEYIYEDVEDIENVQHKASFVILISLIFFCNYYIFVYTFSLQTNTWIAYILFTSIFYYLIFKSKLYKHQYLSIAIILILGIVIDIILENYKSDAHDELLSLLLSFFRIILLSFNYVLIKYTIEKKYVSPYSIGFYNGIINLLLFIISAIIDSNCIHHFKYQEYFDNFDYIQLLIVLGLMATQLGLYTTLFFVDKNDSPCHIFIVFVFGQFANYFNYDDEFDTKTIIVIVFLILMLFFSLVFNEIIELKFCGLSFNTKKNIILRAETEVEKSITADIESNNENNDGDDNAIELSNKSFEEYQ